MYLDEKLRTNPSRHLPEPKTPVKIKNGGFWGLGDLGGGSGGSLGELWEVLDLIIWQKLIYLDPEFRFWGPKVCIWMKNAVRIHLDTSRGLKPP